MVRRPHSRIFPRSVTAPRCVAAMSTTAVNPIVASGHTKRERPQSFRKGLVDVFVPSEARVSKKKQKQRRRRLKYQAARRTDTRPLCTYGTFVDKHEDDCTCPQNDRHGVTDVADADNADAEKEDEACERPRRPILYDHPPAPSHNEDTHGTKDNVSGETVPTIVRSPESATLTELSLDDDADDEESYDILCVDETCARDDEDNPTACTIC